MAYIPLEDEFVDIIGKAQRGLGISDDQLASLSGIPVKTVKAVKAGEQDEAAVKRIAIPLGLGSNALADSMNRAWYPEQREISGMTMFNMPYFDMYVNAYVIRDPASFEVIVFDSSGDCSPILGHLNSNKLKTIYILLTHTHSDHVADLDRLRYSTKAVVFSSRFEPLPDVEPLDEGTRFELGNLRIETRLTSGHSAGGITYLIHGLDRPIAIVGDAIFAGSMGGGLISYDEALKNNRSKILTLPDETVLAPGHGPLTTVGEEKKHNPFFPEYQRAEMF